jgi:hypothetical protein
MRSSSRVMCQVTSARQVAVESAAYHAPRPACLDPDPALAYPEGDALADLTWAQGRNGIVYPSVRNPGGTCLVALRPHAVQSVAQGRVIRIRWRGARAPVVSEVG